MINNNFIVHSSKESSDLKMSEIRFANLSFMDIKINGISVTVMFDTGATITVLKESVVRLIGADVTAATVKAGGSSGNTGEYQTAVLNQIILGSHEILDKEILAVPDEAFDFGTDNEGNSFAAGGFLGWDIISRFKWTIDSVNKTFLIENSTKTNEVHNLTWDNYPLIETVWKDEKIYLGFDSGHTESMLGVKMADKLENLEPAVDSTYGADGEITEDAYITKEFNFTILNTPVSLHNLIVLKREIFGQGNNNMKGLLGADIIQNKKWIIDYPNKHFKIV